MNDEQTNDNAATTTNDPTMGEGYTEVRLILRDDTWRSIMAHLVSGELTATERGELLSAFQRATGAVG